MRDNMFKFFRSNCLPLMGIMGCLFCMGFSSVAQKNNGTLKLRFIHKANAKPVIMRDSFYTTPFGESYNITKLKYYISNISLSGDKKWKDVDGYYLVNAMEEENVIELSLPPGEYSAVNLLLGVDSIRNCSGAQSGALDPMNDMFWTWNNGYVMFKLEGTSPASTADLQRIEHHVGGFKGENKVATNIVFNLKNKLSVRENKGTEITIETDLDKYWKSNADIKIAEVAVCMTTGALAKKISTNFPALFSIKKIETAP
jgi:hypothetical protein